MKLMADPEPEVTKTEDDEAAAADDGEEGYDADQLADPPPRETLEEEKVPPPEPQPATEVILVVEGAGTKDANGRFVLSYITRSGKQYWIKKKAKESDIQYEIWFDTDEG